MGGIQEYQQPANVVGTISANLAAPSPSDLHNPSTGDYGALMSVFNGDTWDRLRSNFSGTALASAERTATTIGPLITNYNGRGVHVILDVTAVPAAPGTGGLGIQIQSIDPVTGTPIGCLDIAAVSPFQAADIYVVELYPGASGTGSNIRQRTSGSLPRIWRIVIFHYDAQPYTYSVGYDQIN